MGKSECVHAMCDTQWNQILLIQYRHCTGGLMCPFYRIASSRFVVKDYSFVIRTYFSEKKAKRKPAIDCNSKAFSLWRAKK